MTHIVKRGDLHKRHKTWFVWCSECGTEFTCDGRDFRDDATGRPCVTCPVCGTVKPWSMGFDVAPYDMWPLKDGGC